jgi:chromosome segregation ATPase
MKDMEYQKEELELELREITKRHEAELEMQKREWAQLTASVLDMQNEKKVLEAKMSELKKIGPELPSKVRDIKLEIALLEKNMTELDNAKNIQLQEHEILKNKQLLADKKRELTLIPLSKEKEYLRSQTEKLRSEYKNLEERVQESMLHQQKKREYLNEIMRLDRENRELQQEMDSIRKAKGR